MKMNLRMTLTAIAVCAIVALGRPAVSHASTILDMDLGEATTDIEFDFGTLHTVDDGDINTTGQQNTGVSFLNEVDGYGPDILLPTGSMTLSGLTPSPAGPNSALLINGFTILQNFVGGTLTIYDSSNGILLSGTLGTSALTGALGNSTGGLFQTSFGNVTTGSLLSYIDPATFTMSMNFTAVKDIPSGLVGMRVTNLPLGPPPVGFSTDLSPFRADAGVKVEASPAPEPTGVVLLLVGSAMAASAGYRRRCR